ncbi:MAG: PaaI family thioesterase [Myxococcota bacterium]
MSDDVKATLESFLEQVPFAQSCGMRIVEADASAGTLVVEMPIADHLERQRGSGQFHGGAVASLIDTAGTFAMIMVTGSIVSTVDMRTDFLRPAVGSLRAEARVRKAGKRIGVVDIDVTGAEDRAVAVGRGTFASVG